MYDKETTIASSDDGKLFIRLEDVNMLAIDGESKIRLQFHNGALIEITPGPARTQAIHQAVQEYLGRPPKKK